MTSNSGGAGLVNKSLRGDPASDFFPCLDRLPGKLSSVGDGEGASRPHEDGRPVQSQFITCIFQREPRPELGSPRKYMEVKCI